MSAAAVTTAFMTAAVSLLASRDILHDGTFENAANYSPIEKQKFLGGEGEV